MKTKDRLINDGQRLVSAKTRFGNAIRVYDDGFGPLWIHRDSMGISGIVRAQKWHEAYEICEDEFFPAADEDAAQDWREDMTSHEQACWDEAYGYRGNQRREADGSTSSIYAKDLNGDSLDALSPALLESLEITLEIADDE